MVHTRIDAARVRTLAQNVVASQLGALLGAEVALPSASALPWVDLEVSPRFEEAVEICIDCPEKAVATAGTFRVLVLLEPEEVSGAAAAAARRGGFDLALGHDAAAVAASGAAEGAFFAHGGTWVPESTWARPRTQAKRAAASLICGDKARTRGHRLRRALWSAGGGALARFASASATTLEKGKTTRVLGAAPEAKAMAVAPYAFHVAVENVRRDGYFTEKLLDCFLLRTVPIYWGCPNLADFGFDVDGVVFLEEDAAATVEAVAAKAVAVVERTLAAAPDAAAQARRAAAVEANFVRAQAFLDLEGRLEAAVRSGLDTRATAPPRPPPRCSRSDDCVWRERTWPLRVLSEAQYASWEAEGYVCLPGLISREACAAAAAAIRAFVGADDAREASWYANTRDIYDESLSPRPKHGPCGMVQMSHHATLWALRQDPAVHGAFADVYGTEELWVTTDRAHFKPPESPDHPAWSDAGPVHSGMHWDVDVGDAPVPFVVQGVVYLEDTPADRGALRVVPRSRGRLAALAEAVAADGAGAHLPESVAAEGAAGTLVLWHSATHHGPGRNVSDRPRVSAYVAMLPVDAGPFLGPTRPPSAALSLADAGTLKYDDDPRGVPRLTRDARVDRWRRRRPLLDEDPTEAALERRPPGEADGAPFPGLTALGRKLVGLDAW